MALHTDRIREALEGPLREAGLVLEDVRAHAAGRHRTLTITVDLDADHAEPMSSAVIADATRSVSELLDGIDVWGDHPYTLEVTSPGAERPLTEPRQFRRVVGRRVRAELGAEDLPSERLETVEGILTDVDDDGIVLEGVHDGVRIAFTDIRTARVVVSLR